MTIKDEFKYNSIEEKNKKTKIKKLKQSEQIKKLEQCIKDKDKRITIIEHRFKLIKRWAIQITVWFLITLPMAILIHLWGRPDSIWIDNYEPFIVLCYWIGLGLIIGLMLLGYFLSPLLIFLDEKGDSKYP